MDGILPRGKQIAAPKTEPSTAFLRRQRSEPGTVDVVGEKKDGKHILRLFFYKKYYIIRQFINRFGHSQTKPNVAAVAEPAPTTL